MNKIILGLITFLLSLSVVAEEIDVTTKVGKVTIYHSGALVSRTGDIDIKAGVSELTFQSLSSKIILNSLKINNKEITIINKTIIKKLTVEQFSRLVDTKEAFNNQLVLLERKYNETGFVSEVTDLEKMMELYSVKILEIKRTLRDVERKIVEAKKLENIELDNENAAILKITVSVERPLRQTLELQYIVGGIGWSPAYEITVNHSSDKTIEIKYLAMLMSQTGEDWDDVAVNLSSSFPLDSPTSLPATDEPWILDGTGQGLGRQNVAKIQYQESQQQQIDELEGVEYQEISLPSFLKLRTLGGLYSIKSNSTVFSFPIMKVNLPATFYYFGFPGIDHEAYLVAEITDWDTLGFVDGVGNISFKGNDIGKSIIRFSEAQDTLLLPVGKDNSVFLRREEMADKKYFKITSTTKKRRTTYAYEYVLKNNNSFPVNFELVDQIPISQTKLAGVEIEKTSGGKISKETGEIVWNIGLSPGQSVKKELIFTIEMDAKYNYSRSKSKSRGRYQRMPAYL